MGRQYWPNELVTLQVYQNGFKLEARASMAYDLMRHYGLIAMKLVDGREFSEPQYGLLSPAELVTRCFRIADLYFDEVERRGEIRLPETGVGEAMIVAERIKRQARGSEGGD